LVRTLRSLFCFAPELAGNTQQPTSNSQHPKIGPATIFGH
jgi:hypothetical protein